MIQYLKIQHKTQIFFCSIIIAYHIIQKGFSYICWALDKKNKTVYYDLKQLNEQLNQNMNFDLD